MYYLFDDGWGGLAQEKETMKNLKHQLAGVLLAAGIAGGTLAATFSPASALVNQILPTTTSLSVTQAATSGAPVVMTATVNLVGLHGLLISPSGPVAFTANQPNAGVLLVGTANVTSCLLGLPALLGLWSASCTATLTITGAELATLNAGCGWVTTAVYAEPNDLLAAPSQTTTIFKKCT
jgi:hypothetical protein